MKEISEALDNLKRIGGVNTKLGNVAPEPGEYPTILLTPDIESPFIALNTTAMTLDLMFTINIYVERTEELNGYAILERIMVSGNEFADHKGNSLGTTTSDNTHASGTISPTYTENSFILSIPYKIKKRIISQEA